MNNSAVLTGEGCTCPYDEQLLGNANLITWLTILPKHDKYSLGQCHQHFQIFLFLTDKIYASIHFITWSKIKLGKVLKIYI